MEKEREIAIRILQEFEGFLEENNVSIPNEEREEAIKEGNEDTAILYGSDYYFLEDKITEILKEKK